MPSVLAIAVGHCYVKDLLIYSK